MSDYKLRRNSLMEKKEKKLIEGPINDSRLTPNLNWLRSGDTTEFYVVEGKKKEKSFRIKAPRQELYPELIDNVWCWVNGCSKCRGIKEKWSYVVCYEHDRCEYCNIHRSKLTKNPWAHEYGFVCHSCEDARKAKEKQEALKKVAENDYNEFDYMYQNEIKCPHCSTILRQDEPSDYDGTHEICECCDGEFSIEVETQVTYTTAVVGERLLPSDAGSNSVPPANT